MFKYLLIISFTFCSCFTATPTSVKAPIPQPVNNKPMLILINNLRASGCKCGSKFMPPVAPLSENYLLYKAALSHARDMNSKRFFSHTNLRNETVTMRIKIAGYLNPPPKQWIVGENIAKGQKSVSEVIKAWRASPQHCVNMMNPQYKEIGFAEVNSYWVQEFGGKVEFDKRRR